MTKKILIFYASIGLGHKYLALNIAAQLETAGFEVRTEDTLTVQSGKLVRVSTAIYLWINRHAPWIWSFFYKNRLFTKLSLPLRVPLAGKHHERVQKILEEFRPDLVIGAHPTGSAIFSYLKRKKILTVPFGAAFSDFHLHEYWLYKEADFFLANIPEQKERMVRLGYPADDICICGIPLQPVEKFDRATYMKKFGLAEDEKVLIMTGGSSGHGLSEEFFDRLTTKIESDGLKKFRILVVTGKNKELFEKLRLSKNPHLLAFGFYERMLELYAVADVFAGKPGGLSTAEGLKHRLPMVITSWLPGMEELNVEFLTKKNLTLPIIPFGPEHDAKVIEQISLELRTGEFKQKLLARNDEIKALANDDPTIICRFIGKVLSQRFAETAVRQQT